MIIFKCPQCGFERKYTTEKIIPVGGIPLCPNCDKVITRCK